MYAVRGEGCSCSGVGASCCFDSNDVGLGAGSGDDSFAGCSGDLRFGNGGSDDTAGGFVMVIMTDENYACCGVHFGRVQEVDTTHPSILNFL